MPCIMTGMDQINSYEVFEQGHLLPCRGAEAIPMVGIPQWPHTWWSMSLLCSSASLSWCIPQLLFSDSVDMPVVVNDKCLGVPQVLFLWL